MTEGPTLFQVALGPRQLAALAEWAWLEADRPSILIAQDLTRDATITVQQGSHSVIVGFDGTLTGGGADAPI
jgi:hypothetical protein